MVFALAGDSTMTRGLGMARSRLFRDGGQCQPGWRRSDLKGVFLHRYHEEAIEDGTGPPAVDGRDLPRGPARVSTRVAVAPVGAGRGGRSGGGSDSPPRRRWPP